MISKRNSLDSCVFAVLAISKYRFRSYHAFINAYHLITQLQILSALIRKSLQLSGNWLIRNSHHKWLHEIIRALIVLVFLWFFSKNVWLRVIFLQSYLKSFSIFSVNTNNHSKHPLVTDMHMGLWKDVF